MLFSPVKDDKQILNLKKCGKRRDLNMDFIQRVRDKFSYFNFLIVDFTLFDMKLISITIKLTLYLLIKQLPIQYTW